VELDRRVSKDEARERQWSSIPLGQPGVSESWQLLGLVADITHGSEAC
jgi:hypothetical protein